MSHLDYDEPAYPVKAPLTCDYLGLTIRAELAARAMQGLLCGGRLDNLPEILADRAVRYADALIAELNKTASNGEGV